MNKINLESMLENKEDLKKIQKALSKLGRTNIVLEIDLEDFIDIFNKYLIDTLDINLFDYDMVIEKTPLMVKIDMTFVKDDSLYEYDYIINELKEHFGKAVVKIIEDDENCMAIINIKAALRMMFSEATEREQVGNIVKIRIDLQELKGDSFEKYFLE